MRMPQILFEVLRTTKVKYMIYTINTTSKHLLFQSDKKKTIPVSKCDYNVFSLWRYTAAIIDTQNIEF